MRIGRQTALRIVSQRATYSPSVLRLPWWPLCADLLWKLLRGSDGVEPTPTWLRGLTEGAFKLPEGVWSEAVLLVCLSVYNTACTEKQPRPIGRTIGLQLLTTRDAHYLHQHSLYSFASSLQLWLACTGLGHTLTVILQYTFPVMGDFRTISIV